MKYKQGFFDVVFMLEVLEHVPPSKTFFLLKNLKRFLKSDGILILSVPTNEGLDGMESNPNGHVRMYTEDLIRTELKISGFEIIEIKTLYAFSNLYTFKKIIAKILKNHWEPNGIIVKAKPL
jgi:SAM-dependent methyltransferase